MANQRYLNTSDRLFFIFMVTASIVSMWLLTLDYGTFTIVMAVLAAVVCHYVVLPKGYYRGIARAISWARDTVVTHHLRTKIGRTLLVRLFSQKAQGLVK